MPFETPRLDDRAFADLVQEARKRIPLYCPEWTDYNLSDPGITLIELFAWMTDIVLYRLNRVPDKNYVKFMELIGLRLYPAEAARVPVTCWLTAPQPATITIPSGTEVATLRTETEDAIVFTTDRSMEIRVPKLGYLLTSTGAAGEGRAFLTHNVKSIQAGYEGFAAFASTPPLTDDALYLGFEEDLSNHIIGIDIEVDTAEGAGIDPNNPPYVWEVLGAEANQNWIPVEVEIDTTLGLNINGLIRVHLPPIRRAQRDEQMAYWLRCRLQLPEGKPGYGVSPTIRRLAVSSWGGTTDATNVTRVQYELLGRSDGSPGQTFFLEHTPVVARTSDEYIVVRTSDKREERWLEVADFSTSNADDPHYTIDSNTGEVRFGPALPQRDGSIRRYGAIPPQNSLILMQAYRSGGGQIGNVAARTINVLKTALPYIERVTNKQAAKGGLDAESLETAKMRVPGHLRSLGRAVTTSDFEYLTREAAPGQIGRVHCLQPPVTNRGEIKILVIPKIPRLQGFISPESLQMSSEVREAIVAYLDERRLLSTLLDVLNPSYQWVETEVRFRAGRHHYFERVQQDVENKLFEFLNPLIGGTDGNGWQFGRGVFVSDLMSVLLTVPGVDYVRSVKLYPVALENGVFTREDEVQEIPLVAHGVVASYKHSVLSD